MTPRREIVHGTVNAYSNKACRCQRCREAWREYQSRIREGKCPDCGGRISNRYESKRCKSCHYASILPGHGSESRYRNGCRCAECTSASSAARKRRRQLAAGQTHD